MATSGYNQIYRQSQLGLSLQSALEDLDDQIDPSLRHKVLNYFDRVRLAVGSLIELPTYPLFQATDMAANFAILCLSEDNVSCETLVVN